MISINHGFEGACGFKNMVCDDEYIYQLINEEGRGLDLHVHVLAYYIYTCMYLVFFIIHGITCRIAVVRVQML